jgi:phosphohistidine phosphatase SixA
MIIDLHSLLRRLIGLLVIFILLNIQLALAETQTASMLIDALKKGHYIIYMRHGLTDPAVGQRDTSEIDFENCRGQRNLSKEGHSQVEGIGVAIRILEIPIGDVRSSPYCRTKDTAQAVFGRYVVDDNLRFSFTLRSSESELLGQYLHDSMLASDQGKGNTVYVGHTSNLRDALNVWPKPEGAMAIFEKEGGVIVYKGLIPPTIWKAAADAGS